MRPVLEILKFAAVYILVMIAFYITAYLMQHILPIDLNPPVQISCPADSPATTRT
ncbi:hypothetical protein KHQ06_24590 [Nocardia tengchongensis]|uniref:Uncharacterized protein n=1 Tax=Nocardia tengchongensis TaxID=2055889 RepID=A0ABX8CKU3_9NOCA|nr:hypothetical protein [Nocardia tengchongensis]QVI19539.1 hypothetical protein KHQ06_24590 [Nocardia tengchongensis]